MTKDNNTVVAGGPMMGQAIENGNLVVTANLTCVFVNEQQEEAPINMCMRCGKCSDVCPAHLSPVLIKDNIRKVKNLGKLRANRCIECGLCSYICPSKIDLRSIVIKAKDKLKEEGK